MKKITLVAVLLGVILLVLIAFFAFNSYIYQQKQADNQVVEPYRATLTGEYLCLPHIDKSGPQTEECAFGLLTETGEYYGVDVNLLSQDPSLLVPGQRITASGMITPIEYLSTDHWRKYPVSGIFSISSLDLDRDEYEPGYVCDSDAFMCADGSTVGRVGPDCQFAACPLAEATSTIVSVSLGGSVSGLSVTISPKEIFSDSRCPSEVTCVWAGTVEVRTVLSTAVGHGEHVLALGESQVFGEYTVTLIGVAPEKTQGQINDAAYRFTFEINKF